MSEFLHPAAHPVMPIVNALKRDADRPLVEMAGGKVWTGGEVKDAISRYAQALAVLDSFFRAGALVFGGGQRGAAGGEHVVDDDHLVAGLD